MPPLPPAALKILARTLDEKSKTAAVQFVTQWPIPSKITSYTFALFPLSFLEHKQGETVIPRATITGFNLEKNELYAIDPVMGAVVYRGVMVAYDMAKVCAP